MSLIIDRVSVSSPRYDTPLIIASTYKTDRQGSAHICIRHSKNFARDSSSACFTLSCSIILPYATKESNRTRCRPSRSPIPFIRTSSTNSLYAYRTTVQRQYGGVSLTSIPYICLASTHFTQSNVQLRPL